jgi:hypothetical protein
MNPRNDSAERASVPPSVGSKRKTWTALIPIDFPVQPISLGASTTWRVETREAEPDFQRNEDPGASGPSDVIDLTSVFQVGHADRSEITAHTVSIGAAI